MSFSRMRKEGEGAAPARSKPVSRRGPTPPMVDAVVRSPGEPLGEQTRRALEPRFGWDMSRVRVHAGDRAAESAESVEALAYTVGNDVVFGRNLYQPEQPSGLRLLAHELAHVEQQSGASPASKLEVEDEPGLEKSARASETAGAAHQPALPKTRKQVLQRTPAAPAYGGSTGVYDRSQVRIDNIQDIFGVGSGSVPDQTIGVAVSAPGATLISWELYNSTDQFVQGYSTISSVADALSRPYVLKETDLTRNLAQGRYTLRCVARQHGIPIAYADKTFFVWTTQPESMMNRGQLQGIMNAPAAHSLGEVGEAKARDMMLQHREAVAATGTGTVQGNQVPASQQTAGVTKSDCTQYVYDILKYAFGAKGDAATWAAVAREAGRLSGNKLRGTALQKALETQAGWVGVFWAPSPRNPEDQSPEHPVAYKRVRKEGLYSKDDVAVNKDKSVIDYRPASPTKEPTFTRIDQLKKVPLGVISARGGTHMTLLLQGQVYEVHWDKPASDPNVIEATPLEQWVWQSGVIVMPPTDFSAAMP